MKKSIKAAIQNIAEFGDTDIFPYSFERYIFRDKPECFKKGEVVFVSRLRAALEQLNPALPPRPSPPSHG